MKKVIIIIIAVIILGAGGYYIYNQAQSGPAGPTVKTDESKEAKGLKVNANNTLLGWLKRGKGVKCTVQAEEGEMVVQTKNNKVRIDGMAGMMGQSEEKSEEPGAMISDGEWVYIWSGDEGMKMNIAAMEESMPQEQKTQAEDYSWENMAKAWQDEEVEYDCKEASIADSAFTPPSNIKFVDFSEFMSGMTELGQEMEEKYGTGEESEIMDGGEEATPEDLEEMMEDFREMMEDMDLPEEVGTQMKMVE